MSDRGFGLSIDNLPPDAASVEPIAPPSSAAGSMVSSIGAPPVRDTLSRKLATDVPRPNVPVQYAHPSNVPGAPDVYSNLSPEEQIKQNETQMSGAQSGPSWFEKQSSHLSQLAQDEANRAYGPEAQGHPIKAALHRAIGMPAAETANVGAKLLTGSLTPEGVAAGGEGGGAAIPAFLAAAISQAPGTIKEAIQNPTPDNVQNALLMGSAVAGSAASAAHPFSVGGPGVTSEALGHAVANTHMIEGGSTFDPRTGENMTGVNKWAVGMVPEASVIQNRPFSPAEVARYRDSHLDLFNRNKNAYIGTWNDPETGLHHMDIVGLTSNRDGALSMGYKLGEKGVFHLGTPEQRGGGDPYIPTTHEGERPAAMGTINDRFDQLSETEPENKVQPYSGVHYSQAKLDVIDGHRRGAPTEKGGAAGREAPRLRAGSENGMGPDYDAPAGFYTYDKGTLGERSIVSRKNAYEVNDNLALANIEKNPIWQVAKDRAMEAARKAGNSEFVAYQVGLNAAERALQHAGFHGYYSDTHPNVKFVFGSHEATPLGTRTTAAPETGPYGQPGKLNEHEQAIVESKRGGQGGFAGERSRKGLGGSRVGEGVQKTGTQDLGDIASKYVQSLGADNPEVEQVNAPEREQGLTPAGSGTAQLSNEELSRNEDFYHVKKNGEVTFLGKQPDATLKNSAVIGVNKSTGAKRVVNSDMQGLNDPQVLDRFGSQLDAARSPHMTAEGDPFNLLTDNEKSQAMTKRLGDQFTQNLRKLPAVQDFVNAAKKGEIGRKWYQRSIQAFQAMRELAPDYFHADDADRWSGVLAATSPQQGVPLNLREALTFWKDWHDADRPMTEQAIKKAIRDGDIKPPTNLKSKLPNVIKALNGEEILGGPEHKRYYKVGNFAQNLKGMMSHVTNDTWMGVFGGIDKGIDRPQFYHAMSLRVRQAANELGWHPAEAQAAIWVFTKTLAEMSGWKAAGGTYYRPADMLDRLTPEKMSGYAQDFADIMHNDPEVRGKLSELGVDLNELDKRLQNVEAKPSAGGTAAGKAVPNASSPAALESLRRSAGRIGKAQRGLEGFTGKYSRPPVEEPELNFGSGEGAGDPSFDFGANTNPFISTMARAGRGGGAPVPAALRKMKQ